MATKTITRYRTRTVRARRRHKSGFTVPLAVVAGFGPLLSYTYQGWLNHPDKRLDGALTELVYYTTGYHKFHRLWNPLDGMVKGIGPILLGMAVHKFIGGKMGVNRVLQSAGIPLLRI